MDLGQYYATEEYQLYAEITAAWLAHDTERIRRAVERLQELGKVAPR